MYRGISAVFTDQASFQQAQADYSAYLQNLQDIEAARVMNRLRDERLAQCESEEWNHRQAVRRVEDANAEAAALYKRQQDAYGEAYRDRLQQIVINMQGLRDSIPGIPTSVIPSDGRGQSALAKRLYPYTPTKEDKDAARAECAQRNPSLRGLMGVEADPLVSYAAGRENLYRLKNKGFDPCQVAAMVHKLGEPVSPKTPTMMQHPGAFKCSVTVPPPVDTPAALPVMEQPTFQPVMEPPAVPDADLPMDTTAPPTTPPVYQHPSADLPGPVPEVPPSDGGGPVVEFDYDLTDEPPPAPPMTNYATMAVGGILGLLVIGGVGYGIYRWSQS